MSDFLKSLTAAAERNQKYVDQANGRELRVGDKVVATAEDAPSTKKVIDTVEDKLNERGYELDGRDHGNREKVDSYLRNLDTTSGKSLAIEGTRNDGNYFTGPGRYSMECSPRIRKEKNVGDVDVQRSWETNEGGNLSRSTTNGRETTSTTGGGVNAPPVNLSHSGSTTTSRSETRGSESNQSSSAGTRATVGGEIREGDVFLRCEVEGTDDNPINPGITHSTFDVEVGKHTIVRSTR